MSRPKTKPLENPAPYNLKVRVQPQIYINYPAYSIAQAKEFRKTAIRCLRPSAGYSKKWPRLKFCLYKGNTRIKF